MASPTDGRGTDQPAHGCAGDERGGRHPLEGEAEDLVVGYSDGLLQRRRAADVDAEYARREKRQIETTLKAAPQRVVQIIAFRFGNISSACTSSLEFQEDIQV